MLNKLSTINCNMSRFRLGKKFIHKKCGLNGLLYNNFSTKASDVTSEKMTVSVNFSKGNKLLLSTGKYARFSDGSAVAQLGNTSVLATATGKEKNNVAQVAPLVVDYRQKSAAAGRIPTNFLRKEMGHTQQEILTSRLIDRSLRPLFPSGFSWDTQISCNLLAVDGVNDPDVIAINATSAALALSDIPWNGPVGAVRIGMSGDELVVNPTRRELSGSSLNLIVVAANQNLVMMLEGEANNLLQQDFQKAIKFGVKECQNVIKEINQLRSKVGKPKREFKSHAPFDKNVVNFITTLNESKLELIFSDYSLDKISRDEAVKALKEQTMEKIKESGINSSDVDTYCSLIFDDLKKKIFRRLVFSKNVRCDGRRLDELRKINGEINLYSPLHGSALFQRGQTQVLCTVALDSPDSALKLDPMTGLTSGIKEKNFFLHYEFPPYATNDIGRPSTRREVGHGMLAERGLRPIVPHKFPFTIRLTSEVLESNGSSSMASVCGGSLALMDAGVPVSMHAAGIAIGLITEYNDKKYMKDYRILTDILGIEDYLGDMDFKLAGTKKGITAVQADIKVPGLPLKVVMEAIDAACAGKANIINIMDSVISKPREPKKSNWPVYERLEIEQHKRGKLLGFGGVSAKKLMLETGAHLSANEDGSFVLFTPNKDSMDEAKEWIEKHLNEPSEPQLEFGAIYKAKIMDIKDIGVMVTLYESMTPVLLHNSQLDQRKISHPSALGLKVGDEFQIKYFGRDPVSGQMRLSRKVLQGPASNIAKTLL